MATMMKAVLASGFGSPDDVLTIGSAPKPSPIKGKILVKVHACSLTPGDYRGLMGYKKVVATPSAWPYIPGGDVCGVVEEQPKEYLPNHINVGDCIVATWDVFGVGGLAEYALVDPQRTVTVPPSTLSTIQGAALANSASHALAILKQATIKPTDRVLLLGGSGGIGTILLQLLRQKGVAHLAATSTDTALLKQLGVDRAIQYEKENWWEMQEYQKGKDGSKPFDVIIDCAVGIKSWNDCGSVLKGCREGGRFVAVVANDWHIDAIDHYYQIFGFLAPTLCRQLFNVVRYSTPYYRMYLGGVDKSSMQKVMAMASEKKIDVVVDPASPHPFTEDGVRAAWNKHIARKGHGKIVIQVSE